MIPPGATDDGDSQKTELASDVADLLGIHVDGWLDHEGRGETAVVAQAELRAAIRAAASTSRTPMPV